MTKQEIEGLGASTYVESRSIGGTDAGAIIGVNRYKTIVDVWNRLAGRSAPSPDNPFMERGRVMEPIIKRLYERESGNEVRDIERLNHQEHPFLHASPDGLIVGTPELEANGYIGNGIAEVKCLGAWTYKQTREEGIDLSYYAQLQHYLFVAGLKWGVFIVFNADLWELYPIYVQRDEPFVAQMVDACVRFWTEHVETGAPPAPPDPGSRMANIPANVGAEFDTVTDPRMVMALTRLKEAKESVAVAEHAKALAEGAVKELMEVGQAVIVPGVGKVTWREERRSKFDWDAFKAAYPAFDDAILAEYKVHSTVPVFRPTFGRSR